MCSPKKEPKVKLHITKKELIIATGIIGSTVGEAFFKLFPEMCMHLDSKSEKVALEISRIIEESGIEINEDGVYYEALRRLGEYDEN